MKKLYRSRKDSKLFGLCGGLAEWLNVDSTLLRVVLLVTAFFTGGTLIPIYFIACLVIPKEPLDGYYGAGYNHHYGYGSGHGPYSNGYGPTRPPTYEAGYDQRPPVPPQAQQTSSPSLDELMRDVEKKWRSCAPSWPNMKKTGNEANTSL